MIPKPVYELLPYIYMGLGLMAVIGVEPILGKACGLLLIITGIVIHQTRWNYRHRKLRLENLADKRIRTNSKYPAKTNHSNTNIEPVSRRQVQWQEDFQKAESSYERGDYAAALKWYRKAAEPGHAPAQVNLGTMYYEGRGVARDFQEALKWYRQAANQGYASAQFNLAMLYDELQDLGEALQWYRKAAGQGYAPAQVNLGAMYAEGIGVPQDINEALKWYCEAANQGYALAQFNLGTIYAEGQEEIPQDPAMAYVWFSRSAVLGDEDAQSALKKVATRLTPQQKARAQQLLKTSSVEPSSSRTRRSAYNG